MTITYDIDKAARTVLSIAPALPTLSSVQDVAQMTKIASGRGYLKPVEDDALREVFSRYLSSRAALVETISDLKPLAKLEIRKKQPEKPELFLVAYAAATMVMRTGLFLVDTFHDNEIIRAKLDEAESRYGLSRKQFTKIYQASTSPKNVWAFFQASRYWKNNKIELEERFRANLSIKPILELLEKEEHWIETSTRYFAVNRLNYRLYSFLRRNKSGFRNATFALMEMSGRVVSEMRLSWGRKRHRVTPRVMRKLEQLLEPGDAIVSRHDDAASNLFLPGYWPHISLYVGTEQQRADLGVKWDSDKTVRAGDPISVLEARKDGVLFRALSDTLAVDACTIIRPKLDATRIRNALAKAVSHEGKEYDFEFDFRRSDRMVCTEVIYRAFDGSGRIQFDLNTRVGRKCLSAEDILDHAIDESFFEVIAIYGFKGNRFATGRRAKELLIQSYSNSKSANQVKQPS